MPETDGFGVVPTRLRDEPMPLTIFVTAYDRYAMKAFEVHALDYLLKPVAKERLSEALDHARKQLQHPSEAMFQRRVLNLLAELDSRQNAPQRIVIKADGEIVCLKPSEIDWAESAGNYVCLHVGPATRTSCARPSPRWKRDWAIVSSCACIAPRWSMSIASRRCGRRSMAIIQSCCATAPS